MIPFRPQRLPGNRDAGLVTLPSVAVFVVALFGGWGSVSLPARGEDMLPAKIPVYPEGLEPVSEANFSALMASSPFLRSLDLSDTLILTGIARIEGEVYVTLLKRDTKETHIVSGAAASNPLGMRLVEVDGDQSDLETVTAQIAMAGGEVFSVRFDERQLKPGEGKPGGGGSSGGGNGSGGSSPPVRDYREGISGDGFRGPPPPEMVKKLSKLSSEQRERLIREIGAARDRGVSSEERQVMFVKMVDRALQERR